MDYLLTIAIPTFNGIKTISGMLDLLLPQCDERVEIIISDNCSTDNTIELIESYKKKYKIRYVRNETNIGADANFLQCMKMANGKFTYLLSDDDILVEGALKRILSFLEIHPDVSLVYLDSVGFNEKYEGVNKCHRYSEHVKIVESDIYTSDRKVFMSYAIRMWGFVSSFLWITEKFKNIVEPEQFFGTFWVQSYIHINCVTSIEDKLGVIHGPCMAAGEYHGVSLLDIIEVDAINYGMMLDYAVESGYFDKKQLQKFYVWRTCFIAKITIIREKECGLHNTSKWKLFKMLMKHSQAWFTLFPYMFIPKWFIILRKKILRTKSNMIIRREGDNVNC